MEPSRKPTVGKADILSTLRAALGGSHHPGRELGSAIDPLTPILGAAWKPGGTAEFCGPPGATTTLAGWLTARTTGRVVLVDGEEILHPPAFQGLGLESARLLLVRPPDRRLAVWAAEQALRCPGVAATVCRLGPRIGTTIPRRLKLAAEAGGGMGFFLRAAAREPPFSDARIVVRPLASEGKETLNPRLEIEAVYLRGGMEGVRCVVELSADARLVSLPAAVARPAVPRLRIG